MKAIFYCLKTYTGLFQEKNGLWAEGSDYILNMYPEEEGWSAYGGV